MKLTKFFTLLLARQQISVFAFSCLLLSSLIPTLSFGNTPTDLPAITNECASNEDAIVNPTTGESSRFFVSSNTNQSIAVLDVQSRFLTGRSFKGNAPDADGIYYNPSNDVLYQLNRTSGAIDTYNSVNTNLSKKKAPQFVDSSTADSKNGREIAVSGNRIVVAQDANDANGQKNRFYVYTANGAHVSLSKTYDVGINLWGIHADGETLYAVVDNSNRLAIFEHFFSNRSGFVHPSKEVVVKGIVRTHGLTYIADRDMMLMTDVGDGGVDNDGAYVVIKSFTAASADGVISASEQIRVAGPKSFLGNPVDIAFDKVNNSIFIAERANGGGRILGFRMPTRSGDQHPIYNLKFEGASAIHAASKLENNPPVQAKAEAKLFVSSNTENFIGAFDVFSKKLTIRTFKNMASDADGIYYDKNKDILYQVNREKGQVDSYGQVSSRLQQGQLPTSLTGSSAAQFSNGREMAESNGRLVVAQDANDANGQQNKLVVFNTNNGKVNFEREFKVDINLWGIHADGETLYAVVDNSNKLAVFNHFFSQRARHLSPNKIVTVEGLVRTHGLTYIADRDMMLLTDIGDAGSDSDGAFIVIRGFNAASADGFISKQEQVRIAGSHTFLGNPVDIAFDNNSSVVFIAERANGGGRVLGFVLPTHSGNVGPVYNLSLAGASAVYLSDHKSSNLLASTARSKDLTEFVVATIAPIPAEETLLDGIQVFPNPSTNYINLSLVQRADQEEITATIFDNSGKQLQVIRGLGTTEKIDISNYPAGIYFIQVTTAQQQQTLKFTKQAER